MYPQLISLTYALVDDEYGTNKCEGRAVQCRIWSLQRKIYTKDVKINNVRNQRYLTQ